MSVPQSCHLHRLLILTGGEMIYVLATALVSLASQASDQRGSDCVRTLASEWEASGEPARDVARAVAIECWARDNAEPPPLGSLAAQPGALETLQRAYFDIAEGQALALIMRIRTCRRTTTCNGRLLR